MYIYIYIYIYIVEEGLDGHGLLLLRVSRVMRSSSSLILSYINKYKDYIIILLTF